MMRGVLAAGIAAALLAHAHGKGPTKPPSPRPPRLSAAPSVPASPPPAYVRHADESLLATPAHLFPRRAASDRWVESAAAAVRSSTRRSCPSRPASRASGQESFRPRSTSVLPADRDAPLPSPRVSPCGSRVAAPCRRPDSCDPRRLPLRWEHRSVTAICACLICS